ncbi:MAG TPA: zinc ribbon domain-containing protein [Gemmatimonadaceae bacterium]|nr:zinc ribbon domain-containing protein [Gemmatimonadaceae bacterium]
MTALLVGTVLAIAALAFVLLPLFVDGGRVSAAAARPSHAAAPRPADASAVDALREIEFDRATGKLSDDDYTALKAAYTREALDELRAREQGADGDAMSPGAEAAADAVIARFRARAVLPSCAVCGPRPEPDALFCSSCGRFLEADCLHCGERVTEPDARFCVACGAALAA